MTAVLFVVLLGVSTGLMAYFAFDRGDIRQGQWHVFAVY